MSLTDKQIDDAAYEAGYRGGLEWDHDDPEKVDVRLLINELRAYKAMVDSIKAETDGFHDPYLAGMHMRNIIRILGGQENG